MFGYSSVASSISWEPACWPFFYARLIIQVLSIFYSSLFPESLSQILQRKSNLSSGSSWSKHLPYYQPAPCTISSTGDKTIKTVACVYYNELAWFHCLLIYVHIELIFHKRHRNSSGTRPAMYYNRRLTISGVTTIEFRGITNCVCTLSQNKDSELNYP